MRKNHERSFVLPEAAIANISGLLTTFWADQRIYANRQFRSASEPLSVISMRSTIQSLGQLRSTKEVEKGRLELFDAIGTKLVIETCSADFQQLGCFQSVPCSFLQRINDPCTFSLGNNPT